MPLESFAAWCYYNTFFELGKKIFYLFLATCCNTIIAAWFYYSGIFHPGSNYFLGENTY